MTKTVPESRKLPAWELWARGQDKRVTVNIVVMVALPRDTCQFS